MPVKAEQIVSNVLEEGIADILVLETGSIIVATIVKTAWDREEARFRLVAPTDRCFVASLMEVRRI